MGHYDCSSINGTLFICDSLSVVLEVLEKEGVTLWFELFDLFEPDVALKDEFEGFKEFIDELGVLEELEEFVDELKVLVEF